MVEPRVVDTEAEQPWQAVTETWQRPAARRQRHTQALVLRQTGPTVAAHHHLTCTVSEQFLFHYQHYLICSLLYTVNNQVSGLV